MAEETTDIIETIPQTEVPKESSRAEERIKQLSDKVELTAKERDEFKTLNETTTRERDFYKDFSEVVGSHPTAKNHQDEIKDKVLKGYSVQDATFAVLGAAGELGGEAKTATTPQVAGGSAATAMPQGGEKSPSEMTQAERRAQLEKVMSW